MKKSLDDNRNFILPPILSVTLRIKLSKRIYEKLNQTFDVILVDLFQFIKTFWPFLTLLLLYHLTFI